MFVIFHDWSVPYEACGSSFIAACTTMEIAVEVLRMDVIATLNRHKKDETYDSEWVLAYNKKIDEQLELLKVASSLKDINEIWDQEDSSFSIEEKSLISNPDQFIPEE